MPIAFLNRARGSGSRAFDVDVLAWRDAVVANGGFVSLPRLIAIDQFVFSERAAGLYPLTADYRVFAAENLAQALTSIKLRRLATLMNGPTFTIDRGIQGDASTSYANLFFDPSVDGGPMTADSVRLCAYERTSAGGSGATVGLNATTNRAFHIRSAGASIGANTSGNTTFNLNGDVVGYIAASRRSALVSDTICFKNGVSLGKTADAAAAGLSLPSGSVFACCLNNGGTPAIFRGTQIAMVAVGALVSDAQELQNYNNVQALMTAIGAQV